MVAITQAYRPNVRALDATPTTCTLNVFHSRDTRPKNIGIPDVGEKSDGDSWRP